MPIFCQGTNQSPCMQYLSPRSRDSCISRDLEAEAQAVEDGEQLAQWLTAIKRQSWDSSWSLTSCHYVDRPLWFLSN